MSMSRTEATSSSRAAQRRADRRGQADGEAASIEFRDLTFTYPGTTTPAVNGISFDVSASSVVALVGPSGCGKSTMLRLVAGLLDPTGGQLLIDGNDATHIRPEHRHIGWVPQSYALFDHLDVTGNISFGLRMRKVPADQRAERVREVLELCRITELAGRSVGDLSGGQRQRVAIARALATKPRLLLLDEPLAALDPQLRRTLRSELARLLRASGVTSLLVTHDQTEALAMADRVAVLQRGTLEQFGSPEQLWNTPANPFVAEFVGSATVVEGTHLGNGVVQVAPGLEVLADGQLEGVRRVQLALRNTDLIVDPDGVPFEVQSREFIGESWLATGELETGAFVTLATDATARPGDTVKIAARPGVQVTVVESE
ncbi:MAG: ABC transporter ATP-binding protein [Actinobacteria bacterium]|jgi:ABC-type Fe3+/spermidine/putrescine transport system ATPase subunit|nr:ABC transporter ATP-binding protein [Actinomycetota bacterium]